MTQPALHDLGVAQLATELRERRVSAVEAAQHFLDRAQTHQHLGAFVALNEEATLAQARAADARLAAGTAGALEGVPLAHKDIFVTATSPAPPAPGCWWAIARRLTPPSSPAWHRRAA
jgi:aspartyl-tRNA(Asn)/glutamyl-tRNA(Gln) amidotransferase subunit A